MLYRFVILASFMTYLVGFGQEYKVEKVPSNLTGSVFSPAYWKNKLVVCAEQQDRMTKSVRDQHGNVPVDLYVMDPLYKDSSEHFDMTFKTDYHDGPISFNGKSDLSVISRNMLTDQSLKELLNEQNHLGLYFAKAIDNGWSELIPFPYNDTSYNCTHPTLNYNGDELIFASNMPGGSGGYDLWRSVNENGQWQKPENLGPSVNTDKNELFPFAYGNSLYFSSNREVYGGLDLYTVNLADLDRGSLILDKSINSEWDDFSLITTYGAESGYFASNRSGTDELYKFEFAYPVFGPCDSLIESVYCYSFYEDHAYEFEDVAELRYEWTINDEKSSGFSIDFCFPGGGEYDINLDVIDTKTNEIYYNQTHYVMTLTLEEQPYITAPDTVSPYEYFQLSAEQTNLPNLMIDEDQYYWSISDGSHFRGIEAVHEFMEPGTYKIQLGVIGYEGEQEVHDCVFRTIVCYDPDFSIDENDGLTGNYLYTKPKDEQRIIYTIEVARDAKEKSSDEFDFFLVDPVKRYKLVTMKDENEFAYNYGNFSDSADANKYLAKMKQFGYPNSTVKSYEVAELEKFDVELSDFYRRQQRGEHKNLLGSPDDQVDIQSINHYYTEPNDSTMVIFSIELARSPNELPADHEIFEQIKPFGEYKMRYLEDEGMFVYLYGNYTEFGEAHPTLNDLRDKGMDEAILRSFNIDDVSDFSLDSVFVFNNVQFDSGEWGIRPDSEIALKKIIEVMLFFPELKIVVEAHTDDSGSETLNLSLSQKRAKSVKEYLSESGVDPIRITYEGYGETKPIDSNLTEEGKQNNRRVQFQLLR